jgi:hypothetical protein
MQHQAETDQMMQQEEKRLYKERQKHYKEILEKQRSEELIKRSGRNSIGAQGVTLRLNLEQREKQLHERKAAATIELHREMQERAQAVMSERSQKQSEKNDYFQYLAKLEEYDQKVQGLRKEQKLQLATELRNSYGQQELNKKNKQEREKSNDIRIIEEQKVQWPIIDFEKKRVSNVQLNLIAY